MRASRLLSAGLLLLAAQDARGFSFHNHKNKHYRFCPRVPFGVLFHASCDMTVQFSASCAVVRGPSWRALRHPRRPTPPQPCESRPTFENTRAAHALANVDTVVSGSIAFYSMALMQLLIYINSSARREKSVRIARNILTLFTPS